MGIHGVAATEGVHINRGKMGADGGTGLYHHESGGGQAGVQLEVIGSYHHGGGVQRVAGASEVMPLDAVELPDVVADGVVDAVQVGEAAGVKPPT